VKRAEVSGAGLSVKYIPVGATERRLDPQLGQLIGHLEVTADTSQPASLQAEIRLYLDDRPASPDRVLVTGRVARPVEVFPARVVLPRATDAGPVYHTTCLVRPNRAVPVTVRLSETPSRLRVDASDRQPTDIRIEYLPERSHGGTRTRNETYIVRAMATIDGTDVPLDIEVIVLPE
jgi:hypothetical protein